MLRLLGEPLGAAHTRLSDEGQLQADLVSAVAGAVGHPPVGIAADEFRPVDEDVVGTHADVAAALPACLPAADVDCLRRGGVFCGVDEDRLDVAQAADWCKRHNIPVIHLDTAALRAGRKGISTHNGARLAWGITDHTDPGAGFPMDVFLDLTRKAMTMTQPTTSAAAAGSVKSDLEALLGDKAYQSLVPGSSVRLSILDILRLGDRYDYEAAGTLAEITKRLERIEATLDRVESMTKGL